MCQRKPAFSAEFPNIRRFNEALTQNYNVVEAHEKGGAKSARDVNELVSEVTALFAGGTLDENAKEGVMAAINRAYWDAKEKNKKYTPKKYCK